MANFTTSASVLFNGLSSWSVGGTLYSKIDPSTTRNIFTTAFLVLNVLIAVVGEYFLKRRNQKRLILRDGVQAKKVPFPLLTPWLSLTSLATYFWKTRTLPGGLLGLLMMATGIFGLVQHYMVNSFILPVLLPTWCDFQAGIVTTSNTHEVAPSPAWPAALLVFQAHTAIAINKGEIGVYDKINLNITSFQPTAQDVLGSWTCTQLADSTIEPADWANNTALNSYLEAQKFLSPSTLSLGGAIDAVNGSYLGFLAWSGILDAGDSSSWGVQTMIANGLGGDSPLAASTFNCSLVKTISTWTPTPMPTNATLSAWKDIMFGFISELPVSHYATQVETILNAMSMLAGSGNRNNLGLPSGANPRYGCVMNGSRIYIAVYLILLLLFVILLTLLVADLYQFIRYRINKRAKLVEEIPTDLISWQLNMLRRMTKDKSLTTKDLHEFSYLYSASTGDFEFVRTKGSVRYLLDSKRQSCADGSLAYSSRVIVQVKPKWSLLYRKSLDARPLESRISKFAHTSPTWRLCGS